MTLWPSILVEHKVAMEQDFGSHVAYVSIQSYVILFIYYFFKPQALRDLALKIYLAPIALLLLKLNILILIIIQYRGKNAYK